MMLLTLGFWFAYMDNLIGGYQSALIGLRNGIFLSLLTKEHRFLLNLIDQTMY